MARHSKDRVAQWYEHNVHLETRTLYLGDGEEGIDAEVAKNVVQAFHMFDTMSTEKPVSIYLNSEGGCWYNGMAIFDVIEQSVSHVDMYALGSVMSMGSIIMQAANTRHMYPHATMMIHDGTENLAGHTQDVLKWAEYTKGQLREMYRIYAKRSGKPVAFWEKRCSHDLILTAEQALELGLIDYIVGEE